MMIIYSSVGDILILDFLCNYPDPTTSDSYNFYDEIVNLKYGYAFLLV